MKSDMKILQIEQRNRTIKRAKELGLPLAQYNKLLSAFRYLKTIFRTIVWIILTI